MPSTLIYTDNLTSLKEAFASSFDDVTVVITKPFEIDAPLTPDDAIRSMLITSTEPSLNPKHRVNKHKLSRGAGYAGRFFDLPNPIRFTVENLILDGDDRGDEAEISSLIYSSHPDSAVILGEGAVLTKNRSRSGGAVFMSGGNLFMKNDAVISRCTASGEGGGLYLENAVATIRDSARVTNNSAEKGGGVHFTGGSDALLKNNAYIADNIAMYGAGVYLAKSTLSVGGSAVIANNNAHTHGGGVYMDAQSSVNATCNAAFTGNTAQRGDGGAIWRPDTVFAPNLRIGEEVAFSGNAATVARLPKAADLPKLKDSNEVSVDSAFLAALNNFDISIGGNPKRNLRQAGGRRPIRNVKNVKYVCNVPSNETVRLRATPSSSGTVRVNIRYGTAVSATPYDATWSGVTYQNYTGYMMSAYLCDANPNGGAGRVGTIAKVAVRSTPSATGTLLCELSTGDEVTYFPSESYSGNGVAWYRCVSSKWSGNGYIVASLIDSDDTGESGGSGSEPGGNQGSVYDRIKEYSNAHKGSTSYITSAQYFERLDYYASLRTIGYTPSGTKKDPQGNYTAMCCASYPYVSRGSRGGAGCTTEYNSYLAAPDLKGTIASLGGFNGLIPGMELFQGTDATKEHMGVYFGKYDFGRGPEHAVYQSTSGRITLLAKYDDDLRQGPNLTSMNDKWVFWGWAKNVVL